MKSPLHVLHLEDNPNDAALVQSTLAAEGITCMNLVGNTPLAEAPFQPSFRA